MKVLATWLVVASLVACASEERVDVTSHEHVIADVITFALPATLEQQEAQGIDSAVGLFRNDTLALAYDFGAYSDNLMNVPDDALVSAPNVGGHVARRVEYTLTHDEPWAQLIAVHIADIDRGAPGNQERKLTISFRCADDAAVDTANEIIASIKL